ncbi:MAG TPA: YCF48-related protein [Kofleriaceae bacterium]
MCVALAGCKKGTGGGTGGGGGGGGWLVGSSGLMVNVTPLGEVHSYPLGAAEDLRSIACRYEGEAWVVGDHGTTLYTDDGGETWTAQELPTQATLRAVATQDAGPVFVAGDGVLMRTLDDGAHWTQLGAAGTSYVSVSAAEAGPTVLAIDATGGLWNYAAGAFSHHAEDAAITGARAVAVSPDGELAMVAGAGLARSADGGVTWTALAIPAGESFADVRIDDDGSAVAVGAAGAIASIARDGTVTVTHVGTANLHTLYVAHGWGNTGYAAGEGGQVWLTHDGGATWSAGPTVDGTVLGIDDVGVDHR